MQEVLDPLASREAEQRLNTNKQKTKKHEKAELNNTEKQGESLIAGAREIQH